MMSFKARFLYGLILSLTLAPSLSMAKAWSELVSAPYRDEQFKQDEKAAIQRMMDAWVNALDTKAPFKAANLYDSNFLLYATYKTKISDKRELAYYFLTLTSNKNFKVVIDEQ